MRYLALLSFLLVACGEDAECVIDTDCELGFYCAEQVCAPIGDQDGDVPDAGADDAEADDAEAEDASSDDAGPEDAGAADAGDDAGEACDFVGTYTVTAEPGLPATCPTLASCELTVLGTGASFDCTEPSGTCALEGCTCTGMDAASLDTTVVFDFEGNTLVVNDMCNYTLAADSS